MFLNTQWMKYRTILSEQQGNMKFQVLTALKIQTNIDTLRKERL
jgi:hypothetical protein